MKRVFLLLLTVFVLTGSFAFAEDVPVYTPGTYTAEVTGRNGPMKVSATFSEHAIEDISIESVETVPVGVFAMERMKREILERQTLNVDIVSGATVSSAMFLMALRQDAEQAGVKASEIKGIEAVPETYETSADLIVVGAGGAGLTAALTAVQSGAKVIVIEKSGVVGGNTVAAFSGINASESKTQEALGMSYTNSEFKEMQMNNDHVHEELVDVLVENSGATIDWLAGLGVPFVANESKPYQAIVSPSSMTTITLVTKVYDRLAETGTPIYFNLDATELVTDGNGKVTGVVATAKDGSQIAFSGKAVLLATGGYGKNHEMVVANAPELENAITDEFLPTVGEGIEMAVAVGAVAVDLDQLFINASIIPNYGMLASSYRPGGSKVTYGIYVNADGQRFANEGKSGDAFKAALLAQPGGNAYAIFDADGLNDTLKQVMALGMVKSAGNAEELAGKLGIDPAGLKETIAIYNADIAAGKEDALGKENRDAIEGTLYGYNFKAGVHYCMGGILINAQGAVVDAENAPIPGLYAAGEVTGGVHGTTRIDGTAVTDTFVFGQIAGRAAAAFARQ